MTDKSEAKLGVPGIWIPAEALFNQSLTHTEKILFGFLQNLSKSKRGCWASNTHLGNLIGVGKQSISNSIANLKKQGYITIEQLPPPSQERRVFIDPEHTKTHRKLVETVHDILYNENYIGIKGNLYRDIKNLIQNKKGNIKGNEKVSKETLRDSSESPQGLLNSSNNEPLILESKQIPPNSLQYNLINFWNNLPGVPTKHVKPNTKVRLTAARYFAQLASGRFADGKKFKPGFFNEHKLSSSILAKQWTREEIKEGLKRLNNIFIEGYWPRNKDTLPKDLATLLYNPGNQNSWFLMVIGQEPELLDNSVNFKPENHKAAKQHPDIIWQIIKQFQDKQIFEHDVTAKTMDEINSIIEYHSHMDFSNNMANYRWGNLRQLIDDFCNFIIAKSYLENSIINISAEGKLFQAFIDECEDELYGRARLRAR